MEKRFWRLMMHVYRLPFSMKLFIAKVFVRCLKDMTNDIVLYNELNLWIETKGRPQTSNPNHWIHEFEKEQLKQESNENK